MFTTAGPFSRGEPCFKMKEPINGPWNYGSSQGHFRPPFSGPWKIQAELDRVIVFVQMWNPVMAFRQRGDVGV